MLRKTTGAAVAAAVALTLLTAAPRPAQAEVGIGVFIGQPTGFDVKLDLSRRSALDFLVGWEYFDDRHGYGHVTYLYQLLSVHGNSVIVPLRLGIGGAIYGDGGRYADDLNLGVRLPFEVGFRFTGTPIELYLEVALKFTIVDIDDDGDNYDRSGDIDGDGGVGIRFMF